MKTIILFIITFISLTAFSQITYFPDRASLTASCTSTLIVEDFEGGPTSSGNSGCDGDFSVAGNSCFPAGELQAGFVITSSDNSDDNPTAFTPADFAGNPTNVVGTNQFPEYTILNFTNQNVNIVALDLYGLPFASTMHVRLFDASGEVDSLTITEDMPGPYFFGFTSIDPILSIEFQAEGSFVEMIGMLEFGTCELTSLNNLSAFNFNYYPNPAENRLNLKSNSNITAVDVLSVIGQHIKHFEPLSNETSIDISNFKSGTYFIKVQIENKTEFFKFFKK